MKVFCTACWAENDAAAERCSHCGADLADGLDEQTYVEKLIRSLLNHPVLETRIRTAWVLGNRRGPRAVPALAEVLATAEDRDFELKKAAVTALGRIGDGSAIPALLNAARSGALPVRAEAVSVLGEIGDSTIAEQLTTIAREDTNEVVRRGAEEALNKILGE